MLYYKIFEYWGNVEPFIQENLKNRGDIVSFLYRSTHEVDSGVYVATSDEKIAVILSKEFHIEPCEPPNIISDEWRILGDPYFYPGLK